MVGVTVGVGVKTTTLIPNTHSTVGVTVTVGVYVGVVVGVGVGSTISK